jgi:hypothetical protein
MTYRILYIYYGTLAYGPHYHEGRLSRKEIFLTDSIFLMIFGIHDMHEALRLNRDLIGTFTQCGYRGWATFPSLVAAYFVTVLSLPTFLINHTPQR